MTKIIISILKIVGYGLGGAVLLAVAAGVLLQTLFVRSLIRSAVVRAAEGALRGDVSIGEIRGNYLTSLSATGISVAVEGSELLTVDELSVSYFLPALLWRTIDVRRIVLRKPEVTLRKDAAGRWNYVKLFPGKKARRGGAGWSFKPGTVEIEGGAVAVIEQGRKKAEETLAVSGIHTAADIDLSLRRKRAGLTVERGSFAVWKDGRTMNIASVGGVIVLKGDLLTVDNFILATGSSTIALRGTVQNPGASPVFDVGVKASALSFGDVRVFAPSVPFRGAASFAATLAGPLSSLSLDADLAYRGMTAEVKASADLKRETLRAEITVDNLNPRDMLPAAAAKKESAAPEGDIGLTVTADVAGFRFPGGRANVTAAVRPSKVAGIAVAGANAGVAIDGAKVELRPGELRSGAGTLAFSGEGNLEGLADPSKKSVFDLRLEAGNIDLAPLVRHSAFQSDLHGAARVIIERPPASATTAVTLSADAGGSTAAGLAVKTAALRAVFRNGTADIGELSVVSEVGAFSARGRLAADGMLDFSYRVDAADLGALARAVPPLNGLGGSFGSAGTVGGSIRDLRIRGSANGKDLRYAAYAAGTLDADFEARPRERFPLSGLDLRASGIAAGSTGADSLALELRAENANVPFVARLRKDAETEVRLAGAVRFGGDDTVSARADTFVISLGTTVWTNEEPVVVEVSPAGVAARSFRFARAGGYFRLSGAYEYRGNIYLDLAVTAFDAGTLEKLTGTQSPLHGSISGRAAVRGKSAAPAMDARLRVDGGSLGGLGFDVLAVTAAYADGKLRFRLAVERGEERLLAVRGEVPVNLAFVPVRDRLRDEPMTVVLESRDIGLSFLEAFSGEIREAAGAATLDVTAGGTPRNPRIAGKACVSGGVLELRSTGARYSGINGCLVIDGNRITADGITVHSGPGSARISGAVSLSGLRPARADIRLNARRFRAVDTETLSAIIDADVSFSGSPAKSQLKGAVTIPQATLVLPKGPQQPTEEITVVESDEGKVAVVEDGQRRAPGLFGNLSIDGTVTVPGNAWIRGSGINAEVRGELTVAGTPDGPVTLAGKILAVRGTYELRGRTLRITEGTVVFTGGPAIDPMLDITATARIRGVSIELRIGGTLSKPDITLASSPPMDESDIISYLIFGKPPGELNQPENQVLQQTTVQVVGELATEGIRDVLGRELAPEVIEVEPAGGGFSVGKYVTNELFIRYDWRFGAENVTQLLIDYEINRNFLLQSLAGDERTSGLDLFWTLNY